MIEFFSQDATARLLSSWPWYLTRASGFLSVLLLVLLLMTGISSFTGHQYKFMAPLKAWANHRTLGIAFSISVSVHILSLLFDKFISFNIFEVFVPFVSHYKHAHVLGLAVGSLGVALGVISLYLVVAIIYTSLSKIISTKPSFWKVTHYLSYLVIILIFFHSIMIGTDLRKGIWRASWIVINVVLVGLVCLRLRRVGALKRDLS